MHQILEFVWLLSLEMDVLRSIHLWLRLGEIVLFLRNSLLSESKNTLTKLVDVPELDLAMLEW